MRPAARPAGAGRRRCYHRRMTDTASPRRFTLEPDDLERLANLCGPVDAHLRAIEAAMGVEIGCRGNVFAVSGPGVQAERAERVLRQLYDETQTGLLDLPAVESLLADQPTGHAAPVELSIRTKRGLLRPRGDNQQRYLRAIAGHAVNFGVGPAGTGKTYLAVACAVEALNASRVQRLVLVRPAVEAGEKLGFLPGDLSQKVDPYLRPLYDALYEMLGVEKVARLLERNVIEVAPLAYMRGRTLNDAFVILDEAQNTTVEQMKMFLTRIGFGSTAVVTGDLTQIDLPKSQTSGLRDAVAVLHEVEGISFTFFTARDVVRHPLVARIVDAYEARDAEAAR